MLDDNIGLPIKPPFVTLEDTITGGELYDKR